MRLCDCGTIACTVDSVKNQAERGSARYYLLFTKQPWEGKVSETTELTNLRAMVDDELAKQGLANQNLIERDQLIEGYSAYITASSGVHNDQLRESNKSFFEAMCELDTVTPPEEDKRILGLIADACGL